MKSPEGSVFPDSTARIFDFPWRGRGVDRLPLQKLKMAMAVRTPHVIQTVRDALPPNFPGGIAESIFDGMERAARRLTD